MAPHSSAINQNLSAEREEEEESARYADIGRDSIIAEISKRKHLTRTINKIMIKKRK